MLNQTDSSVLLINCYNCVLSIQTIGLALCRSLKRDSAGKRNKHGVLRAQLYQTRAAGEGWWKQIASVRTTDSASCCCDHTAEGKGNEGRKRRRQNRSAPFRTNHPMCNLLAIRLQDTKQGGLHGDERNLTEMLTAACLASFARPLRLAKSLIRL